MQLFRLRVACNIATPHVGRQFCNGFPAIARTGASATLHRISKNDFFPFRGQSTTLSSMVVVSRFSDFNFERYSTLQHLATFCNICNNFQILHTGVSRPPELISDEGNTLFLVVSNDMGIQTSLRLGFSSNLYAMCFTLTRIEQIYFVRLACACQHIVFTA